MHELSAKYIQRFLPGLKYHKYVFDFQSHSFGLRCSVNYGYRVANIASIVGRRKLTAIQIDRTRRQKWELYIYIEERQTSNRKQLGFAIALQLSCYIDLYPCTTQLLSVLSICTNKMSREQKICSIIFMSISIY